MNPTMKMTPAAGLATLMWFAPAPAHNDIAAIMLSRIVEAHASAMELNDLLAAGLISTDRYERAANDRDDAVDAAAEFLGRGAAR
jgi:hypothetical protein